MQTLNSEKSRCFAALCIPFSYHLTRNKMKTRKTRTKNEYSHPAANESPEKHRRGESTAQFADNRSNAVAQKKLQEKLENSPLVEKTASLTAIVSPDSASKKSMQLAEGKDNWEHLKSKVSITNDPMKMAAEIAGGKTSLNADGASMARRMDRSDQIGSPELLFNPEHIRNHLGKFAEGAHAFITPEKNKNIKGDWGWGKDNNFVSPLPEADALVNKAQGEKGLFTLEEALGIPHFKSWSWANVNENPENVMWRYIIPKPQDYNLDMASGKESGAYKDEWIAGGKTLGGANEAVIDKIPKTKLLLEIAKGKIITNEEKFRTTSYYFEEFKKKSGEE